MICYALAAVVYQATTRAHSTTTRWHSVEGKKLFASCCWLYQYPAILCPVALYSVSCILCPGFSFSEVDALVRPMFLFMALPQLCPSHVLGHVLVAGLVLFLVLVLEVGVLAEGWQQQFCWPAAYWELSLLLYLCRLN